MKMKKLLASALAATMVLSTMVGALVSAAKTVGTITAGDVTRTVGDTDTITADINIAFTEDVVAPHNIISVAIDGYTLSNVALGTVTYAEGSAEGVVTIDADGSNLAAGKILLEAPVDSKAPTVKAIALTATFVDADETDTAVGTYAIVVNGDDMTDVNEASISIDAKNGTLTVEEAAHVCTPAEAVKENEKAADCTTDGSYDLVVYCSECKVEISRETFTVDALGHTAGEAEEENREEPTCAVDGSYDSVVYCTVCETEMSRTPATIPATGNHTAGEAKEENRKDATCGADGSYDAVVYCTVCNTELSRTPATIPATGAHNYEEGVCGTCGAEDPNYEPPVVGPVVDETLSTVVYDIAPRVENTFGIRYELYINPADYGADSFEFRVTRNELDSENGYLYSAEPIVQVYTAADTEIEDPQYATWNMFAFSHSFALYEMQVPTTYSIHLFKDGVEVSYYTYNAHTLAKVATDRYGSSEASEDLKKILVACLNVGTKAQELFASRSDTDSNSPLKIFAAPNAGVDTEKYATSYDSLVSSTPTMSGAIYDASVTINAAPTLRCEIFDSSFDGNFDSFYVEASYASKYLNKTVLYTYEGTSLPDYQYGMSSVEFDETFLFDTDKEITINVKKVADDSVVGTAVYTIDTLLLANVNAEGIRGEAFQAVASFAACCRDFFPNY